MSIGAEERTERLQLATGASYRVYRERPPNSPELLETAARRYGFDDTQRLPSWQTSDPIAVAEKILYRAKTILRRDKYHARMMFIRDGNGRWHHRLLVAEDRTEKHILMRIVSSFIESVGGDALIDIAEAWILPQSAISELQDDIAKIEKAPSRGEALKLVVATRDGVLRNYTTPFSRGPLGGIKLGDTVMSEDVRESYYLAPVFEVWRRQGVRSTNTGKKVRWLWEPDPLDRCYCGSTKRFVECCQPHLERVRSSEVAIDEALAAGNADEAEQLARAGLAQYVIWIKEHTAGTRHVAQQLHRDLINVDVPALHVHIRHLRDALAANGHQAEFKPALQRIVSFIGVPEIAIRLHAIVATELWNAGSTAAATAEIRKLGPIDDVQDSLALSIAAKLLPLSDDARMRLLDRAATMGYVAGERVSAKLELARALLAAGKQDATLVSIDSAIGEAKSDGAMLSLLAQALGLRWEVTNDNSDFEQALEAIRALPGDEHWRDLASLLIDHGDYDSADAVLEQRLERGDVAAHLLAIDSQLRRGKTESAKDLLKRINNSTVPTDLSFPYAYTTGLVAGLSGDPQIRQTAIKLLSGLSDLSPQMARMVQQILSALGSEISDTRSMLERMRRLLTRNT